VVFKRKLRPLEDRFGGKKILTEYRTSAGQTQSMFRREENRVRKHSDPERGENRELSFLSRLERTSISANQEKVAKGGTVGPQRGRGVTFLLEERKPRKGVRRTTSKKRK